LGKRSEFERIDKDFYRSIDPRIGAAIAPFLLLEAEEMGDWGDAAPCLPYAEPCFGQGDLYNQLLALGHACNWASDISAEWGIERDALDLTAEDLMDCAVIITNPPWSRPVLHQMITHFSSLKPTWLLFDADWMHTKQSIPYMDLCTDIVSVGRLKWIPDTNMSGKDNCAWYRFDKDKDAQTRFHGR